MTERDKRFAEEFLIDLNHYAAAIRAGFSPNTAKDASAWIREQDPKKPQLKKLVDQLIAERSRRTGITADRVLNELAKLAFVNADAVIDPDTAKVRPDAKREDKAAIQSVTVKSGRIEEREIRLADKTRSLELLGRHLGLFKDNAKIDGAGPVIVDDG